MNLWLAIQQWNAAESSSSYSFKSDEKRGNTELGCSNSEVILLDTAYGDAIGNG